MSAPRYFVPAIKPKGKNVAGWVLRDGVRFVVLRKDWSVVIQPSQLDDALWDKEMAEGRMLELRTPPRDWPVSP